MALNTVGDLQTELLVRNNRTTTDGFITDTMLNSWTYAAHVFSAGFHKWPFTEGRVSTTYVSSREEWNFEGYKADSFRLVQVGGYRLQKLNFEDYQNYKEIFPTSVTINSRNYSDFGRLMFVNPNLDVSGTLVAYGQYMPLLDVTDKTAQTIFSGFDEEGNEGMIQEMTSYLRERENAIPTIVRGKIISASIAAHSNAQEILERVWRHIEGEQFGYQTKNRNMYKSFDILQGGTLPDIRSVNQFGF